jgi:hypothetical protein
MSLSVYYRPIFDSRGGQPQVTILAAQAIGGFVPRRRAELCSGAHAEWEGTFQYLAFQNDRRRNWRSQVPD